MTTTDDITTTITPTRVAAMALTIGYSDALNGIAAVLPHAAGAKEFTQIIAAVRVTPTEFVTTDRYAIGIYKHGAFIHPDTDSVVIPRAAAEWLIKQTPKMLNRDAHYVGTHARVTFTATEITIHTQDAAGDFPEILAVTTFSALSGNYPPVQRLVDGWEPATDAGPVSLNMNLLTRFEKSAKAAGDGRTPVARIELGKSENPGKPAPIRVTIGDKFVGLLQPNLLLR